MSLRRQVIIVFTSAILLPILIVGGVFHTLLRYQVREIKETYGFESTSELFTGVTVEMVGRMTKNVEEKIKNVLRVAPDRLSDEDFLRLLNEELQERNSYILVRRDEQVIFNGAPDVQLQIDPLPGFGSSDQYTYLPDSRQMMRQIDFKFSDKTRGSVFILTRVEKMLPEMRSMLLELALALVLVIVLMLVAISAWTYRVILKPVRMLRDATQKIRDGDLDFKIEVRELDELGQLCQDFDEMRQRLKESAESKVQFDAENRELIRNISHDLKTPITAVKGYAEAIRDGVADTPEKMDRYIQTICNKANDMERLIDELAYYSKIDTNRIPYEYTRLNVEEYFEDCAAELQVDLEADGIRFEFENRVDSRVEIIADPEQLKKVINNIVSNSVKYMDKEEKIIHMQVQESGDFIHVAIEDNGRGIAQKDLPLIFERFYRADAARTSSAGGSGIGLSIVKKIIEDHGGRIWAASREGVGTTLHFELRKYEQPQKE